MAVNTLSFNQLSTLLTSINEQATGQRGMTPTNTSEFVSVAQTVLHSGYDTVINAISQVLSRTIFSVRPYNRKFKALYKDEMRWGNHVRKLQMVDGKPEDDQRQLLEDGKSIDQQKVKKPVVLQTNFYGANVYQRSITIFKDQLDTAFSSPDEFGRFIGMVLQNVSDTIEADHENMARMTLVNMMGGIIANENNVVHLVSEYNDVTGAQLDTETVNNPENFATFWRWAWARIKTVSDAMTERSIRFHMNVDGKEISRHTPKDKQVMYMYAPLMNSMEASVLSTTFHDDYLKGMSYEAVNYWQSIDSPNGINIKPTYMTSAGQLTTPEENVVQSDIVGVLFDEEAAGVTTVNQWTASAPFNASGGYTNTFWHFTDRYYNDFTENAVVFTLD